jgi:hypothetical protein
VCNALIQTEVGISTAAAAAMTMMKSYKSRKLHLYKKKLLPLYCVFLELPADSLGHGSVPLALHCKNGANPPSYESL